MPDTDINRCQWAGTDQQYIDYHDLEWGVPIHDDRALFEFLTLEGAQAGLAWAPCVRVVVTCLGIISAIQDDHQTGGRRGIIQHDPI